MTLRHQDVALRLNYVGNYSEETCKSNFNSVEIIILCGAGRLKCKQQVLVLCSPHKSLIGAVTRERPRV